MPPDWRAGFAPFGYRTDHVPIATTLRRPTYAHAPTTYYRTTFRVGDPGAVTRLSGEVLYDDGIVVWLNGVRVDSRAIGTASIRHEDLAEHHDGAEGYEVFDWTPFRGVLVAGENVLAVELHQARISDDQAVFDLALDVITDPPPLDPINEDIPAGSVWAYRDHGEELGSAWRKLDYDDSGWSRATAPLGYGTWGLGTSISYGADGWAKHRTTYFRRRFHVADRSKVAAIMAEMRYDDGAVIAVEVHQASPRSPDLVFDLTLIVETPAPEPPLAEIPAGARWWVRAEGDLQPALGDPFNSDLSSWASLKAPLGYGLPAVHSAVPFGPDPAHRYMTTYARRTFVVEDPSRIGALAIEAMYEDGLVLYLNGQEIARRGLPEGPLTADTAAAPRAPDAGYEKMYLPDAARYLRPGVNELSARIHQDQPASHDLLFDLRLRLEPATTPLP